MMCINSKESIEYCAQVEGTRGEVFAVSPIALQSRWKRVPNERILMYGHIWPSTPECSFKIGDRHCENRRWNWDERATSNVTRGITARHGSSRHQDVFDGSDGLFPLWRSHSIRMEVFFADEMSQGFQTCLHCRRCPMIIWLQMMKVKIRWTWVVLQVNRQSPQSQPNSPSSSLPIRWGRPTTVYSKSGRMYGWLGLWRGSIRWLSGGRTIWTMFEIDPGTGRLWWKIVWRHLRTGCCWFVSLTLNGFTGSALRLFWRNLKQESKRQQKGKARQQATGDGFRRECGQKSMK